MVVCHSKSFVSLSPKVWCLEVAGSPNSVRWPISELSLISLILLAQNFFFLFTYFAHATINNQYPLICLLFPDTFTKVMGIQYELGLSALHVIPNKNFIKSEANFYSLSCMFSHHSLFNIQLNVTILNSCYGITPFQFCINNTLSYSRFHCFCRIDVWSFSCSDNSS